MKMKPPSAKTGGGFLLRAYLGGESRNTYSAAILPSRTMATSSPVYSKASPRGPEPQFKRTAL